MSLIQTEIVVIGAGPGGYAAAFYAADKGKKVILVEHQKELGGVCLNRGCIPSKALLHAAKLLREAQQARGWGISFGEPEIDLEKMRAWKNSIVSQLSDGIHSLAQKRGVEVICGRGSFESSDILKVLSPEGEKRIQFEKAIVAIGSESSIPKALALPSPRVMTSTEALEIEAIPKRLLVVGGGYIGMELATIYSALGSRVVVVEALGALLPGADNDLTLPVKKFAQENFEATRLSTEVVQMEIEGDQVKVMMKCEAEEIAEHYDRVLISVGREPRCGDLGLEKTAAKLDEKGFIKVDFSQQTADPRIFAIGDVVGGAMLAHKASREARVAVEVMTGEADTPESAVMPVAIFTDPEIAWCGLTEAEARRKKMDVQVVRFSWLASGRAMTLNRTDGMTKLILDPSTERVLGVGIVGVGAGELISEGVLAVQMGATARDVAGAIHPHPTLSETVMESAEAFYGYATHTMARRKAARS